jgi:hypothetical protein
MLHLGRPRRRVTPRSAISRRSRSGANARSGARAREMFARTPGFPALKTIDGYDLGFATGAPRAGITELAGLAFVEPAENVALRCRSHRCVFPTPEGTAPGCAFARATRSDRLRTPSFTDTSTTFGAVAMIVTSDQNRGEAHATPPRPPPRTPGAEFRIRPLHPASRGGQPGSGGLAGAAAGDPAGADRLGGAAAAARRRPARGCVVAPGT